VTEEIEAVATAADVFPRIVAQGYALAGMPERAALARDCRRSRLHSTIRFSRCTTPCSRAFAASHDFRS
jgi:hypothetical protein